MTTRRVACVALLAVAQTLSLAAARHIAFAQSRAPSPAPQRATFAPCPPPPPRFSVVAIDPATPVAVLTTQQFVVALRAPLDAGYRWQLQPAAVTNAPAVRADGTSSIDDVAFQNLDRPGQPPLAGGQSTELFLFTALAPGTTTLTFGLMRPDDRLPTRTTTYTVRVSPNVLIC